MLFFLKLPIELQEDILSFINDTPTILESRLVCSNWRKYWNRVPLIQNNITMGYFVFEPKYFRLENMEGSIVRDIKFKSYGRFLYQEYDDSNKGLVKKRIKQEKIFNINSMDNSDLNYRSFKKINLLEGTIEESKILKNLNGYPCLIS